MSVEGSPVDAFVEFARYKSEDTWGLAAFAGRVELGLAGEPLLRRSGEALKAPKAWELDKHLWRGGVGPFSAIETLGDYPGELTVTNGPHTRCSSDETIPVPKRLRGLEQWSIQPADAESCNLWFAVDVFLRDGVDIAGVTLDLWEP